MAITKKDRQVVTDRYALYHGDCIEVLKSIPDDSIGEALFSPPFADLFSYSDSDKDMGNSRSYKEFFEHFGYLVTELKRVLMPGRVIAVHCMDLPIHVNKEGYSGTRDFPGDLIRSFQQQGFIYHCPRITIWKDPLIAATRTHAKNLAHGQIVKDSVACGVGTPDTIIVMRKPGDNPVPVANPNGFTEYPGSREMPKHLDRYLNHTEQRTNKRSHWIWQQIASPVWMDIRQTLVLPYRKAKEGDDQRHICLAKGSMVLTKERGYVPIQQVTVGEHALTHKGRWRPIIAVQSIGIRDVVTIRGQGIPGLTLTPDHKLWARKSDWVRQRDGAERTDPAWIEAADCLGGYLNLKLPEEEVATISDPLHWWIVGRWLADGHWDSRGSIHISSGYHKTDFLLGHLGEYGGFIHDSGTSHQVRIKDRDGRIRETLSRCGVGASEKQLPSEAFTLPIHLAKSLLDGYLSGDGHYREDRRRWIASSVSRNLLMGMGILIQRAYGSIASIYAGRSPRCSMIQGRKVKCKQDWILSFDLPKEGRYKQQFILDDGAWKKVRTIEDSGKCEVWNIRVADDESFTAEGCIVKNCPLQLDTIKRCLMLWSTTDDVVLTPFMGIGSEVYCAVQMGRKAIGIELKGSYFRQAVRNMEALQLQQEQKRRLV